MSIWLDRWMIQEEDTIGVQLKVSGFPGFVYGVDSSTSPPLPPFRWQLLPPREDESPTVA